MENCVFCDIVAGKAPASIVYEDSTVCAFLTIGHVNPGHLLVIPKEHLTYLADVNAETGAHLFQVSMCMAEALRSSGLRCEGVNLFLADGAAAFQEIPHVHMHVLPRFRGDTFKIEADWNSRPSRDELDRIAARIQRAHELL